MKSTRKWGTFGWYNFLVELVESGVFKHPNLTPFQSVFVTPVWDALIYAAQKKYMS